jgi:hypothetical protein
MRQQQFFAGAHIMNELFFVTRVVQALLAVSIVSAIMLVFQLALIA